MSYHFKIYVNLKKLPEYSRSESIACRLPDDMEAHPLSNDISVPDAYYYFDSVEFIYLAGKQEFNRFIAKIMHTIRYSIWQSDAHAPGPFRDLLWPGQFLKRTSIFELLTAFDEWDARFRSFNDIHFYKVYCTVRKALRRLSDVANATDALILGEIYRNEKPEPLENEIRYPFKDVELDLEVREPEPYQVEYYSADTFGDRHLI